METLPLLDALRAANPALRLDTADHPDFAAYGQLIDTPELSELIAYLTAATPVPQGSQYVASDPAAEALPVHNVLRRDWFGELDMQIGWCNGTNTALNALEYHASIEIDVAAGDLILLLARRQEIQDGTLGTDRVRGFLLRAGQAALLYDTTLHFAPCAVNANGFRCAILLPRGTNTPLDAPQSGAALRMKNKWLLAHPLDKHLVDAGAYVGLTGHFLSLRTV